jgi:hypothetical protein
LSESSYGVRARDAGRIEEFEAHCQGATDVSVRRHPVADRSAAGTACAGMTSASQVHRAMRGEVCLGTSKAARFSVGPPSTTSFDGPCSWRRRFAVAQAGQKRDPGLETARNLANVGLDVSRPRSIKIQSECELVHTSPSRIGFLILARCPSRIACTFRLRRLSEQAAQN